MRIHKSVTIERVVKAVEETHTSLSNPGFCIYCGVDTDSCEPDARRYECEDCGKHGVYGAEELLMRLI